MNFARGAYVSLLLVLVLAVTLVVLLAAGVVHPKGEGRKHIDNYRCNDYNDPSSALPLCPPPGSEQRPDHVVAAESGKEAADEARLAQRAAWAKDQREQLIKMKAKEEQRERAEKIAEESREREERAIKAAEEKAEQEKRRQEATREAVEQAVTARKRAESKEDKAPQNRVHLEASEDCETAQQGSTCWTHVDWAMHTGISSHPTWYGDLTRHSSFEQFQAMLHFREEGECPAPCPDQVRKEVKQTTQEPRHVEKPCRTVQEGEECWTKVQWAKTDGIREHPDWYGGLTETSSFEDFQQYIREKKGVDCPKPCRLTRHFLQMSMA